METLIAMTIFAIVMTAALAFFSVQMRAFTSGADYSVYTAGAQFAMRTLERQVRAAGTNTVARQPWMVYAGTGSLAFNADYVSNIVDPSAVYFDPDAPAGEVSALRASSRITLPATSITYPDSTYWAAPGIPSPAELVVFFFAADTSTARADDFALYRQTNAAAPVVIARNVLRADTTPFFQYYRVRPQADGRPGMSLIPSAALPLRHAVPLHLAAGDTGVIAAVDSIRAIRVTFAVSNARTGIAERRVRRSRWIWLRNGGLVKQRSCGSPPLFNAAVFGVPTQVAGTPAVQLAWSAAVDEGGGEDDVIRYVVWRSLPGGVLGDPYLSIPAGASSYSYQDRAVASGEEWVYSVAAQDCTPALSPPVSTGTIIIP